MGYCPLENAYRYECEQEDWQCVPLHSHHALGLAQFIAPHCVKYNNSGALSYFADSSAHQKSSQICERQTSFKKPAMDSSLAGRRELPADPTTWGFVTKILSCNNKHVHPNGGINCSKICCPAQLTVQAEANVRGWRVKG